jgi:hypothetical protein
MITAEMKQKMFDKFWISLEDENGHQRSPSNRNARKAFTAALNLILPLLEKSLEANRLYGNIDNYSPEYLRQATLGRHGKLILFIDGGKTARLAIAQIESELNKK